MDEQYVKMCKEAGEIQREMDGLNKDELNFLWSDGYHVYIKFDDIDCCLKRLKTPVSENLSEFKIPRQEDLQEILCKQFGHDGMHPMIEMGHISALFNKFIDRLWKEKKITYPWNLFTSFDSLWLACVMDTMFGKEWDSKTESWKLVK